MADIKQKFGTSAQALTITIASLANASLRQSTYVDNATNLFLNALLTVSIRTNASGTSSTGYVNVYAYGTADGGTLYNGGASGSDAAYSAEKTNLKYLGTISAVANGTTYNGTFDVAGAFGGALPERWGIVLENLTGAALDSTGGNHSVKYQGVYGQAV